MKTAQPLHIFRKDLIHIWPEVLVSIILVAGFGWTQPMTWSASPTSEMSYAWPIAAGLLRVLIPISWLVVLSRLVQDEELVGDRQFWITRPYTWHSLLLSKLLFVVVFLCVPFLLMQSFMLHRAHLYPTHALSGLLEVQLTLLMVAFLPLLAIAAVTTTFVRFASSALGALIYLLVVSGISAWLVPSSFMAPNAGWIFGTVFSAMVLAAILLAYMKRRTTVARILLAATPLALLLVALLMPVKLLINASYPSKPIATLAFSTDALYQQPTSEATLYGNKYLLKLPVSATAPGQKDTAFLTPALMDLTIDGPSGAHYHSGWQAVLSEPITVGSAPGELLFRIPSDVYRRFKDGTVTLHLDLAAQLQGFGTPWTVKATEAPFALPDHANCQLPADEGAMDCHFAFRLPEAYRVTTGTNSNTPAGAFIAPSASVFDPVVTEQTTLQSQTGPASLTAGTPVTFTPLAERDKAHLHLDVPNVAFDRYIARRVVKQVQLQQQ